MICSIISCFSAPLMELLVLNEKGWKEIDYERFEKACINCSYKEDLGLRPGYDETLAEPLGSTIGGEYYLLGFTRRNILRGRR